MVLQSRRVASAETVRELVDSAFATRFHDLTATLTSASMAVVLAEELRDDLPPDLFIAAWTEYGNALRLGGQYQEAERALNRAEALPASDLHTKVHFLEVKASLHRNTGRHESAALLLCTAIEHQVLLHDSDVEARLHNLLGIVYQDWGKGPQAMRSFRAALSLLGPTSQAEIVVSTGHNLFETLIEAGRLEAASAALVILEPYYRSLTSNRIAAKAEWMRARLCRAMRQFPAAELAYERAFDLLSQEPRSPELTELAAEMADLLGLSKPAA